MIKPGPRGITAHLCSDKTRICSDKNVNHTHLGSIGNLGLSIIQNKFDEVFSSIVES